MDVKYNKKIENHNKEIKRYSTQIMSTCISPCNNFYLAGSNDGEIIIWDLSQIEFKNYYKKMSINISNSSEKKIKIIFIGFSDNQNIIIMSIII